MQQVFLFLHGRMQKASTKILNICLIELKCEVVP